MSSGLIECRFCGKKLRSLNGHLATHGLTFLEYRKLFPDQKEFQSVETREKRSNSMKGMSKPPWTEEARRNVGLASLGHEVSKEARQKIGDANRGVPHPWNAGSNNWTAKPENAEKRARAQEKATRTARRGSSIERDLHWVLNELDLTWRKRTLPQVTTKGVVHVFDAVVEACNVEDESFSLLLALEVDGCYWHGCEKCGPGMYEKYGWVRERIDRDRLIDQTCYELGIPILRFWEHDMKNLPYVMGTIVRTLLVLQIRKVEMLKAKAEEAKVVINGNST